MDLRELIILLLGFAIVAVVLRGLYVAFQARKGQIRLAIDKNIPTDVDLNALELAELPGGGARVVERSLDQAAMALNAVESANSKAASFELDNADANPIPVLMDAVELTASQAESEEVGDFAKEDEGFEEESIAKDNIDEESYEAEHLNALPSELAESENKETENDFLEGEDPDDVLFDYDESEHRDSQPHSDSHSTGVADAAQSDMLASVKPDYPESDDAEEDDANYDSQSQPDEIISDYATAANQPQQQDADSVEDDSYGSEEYQSNEEEFSDQSTAEVIDESSDYDQPQAVEQSELVDEDFIDTDSERQEPSIGVSFEEDDFSMTAGERIGSESKTSADAVQSSLFETPDEGSLDSKENQNKPKRRSLFAAFRRKPKPQQVDATPTEPEHISPTTAEFSPAASQNEESEFGGEFDVEATTISTTDQHKDSEQEQIGEAALEPSEVLVVNVMAKEGQMFAGEDLLEVLITSGLKFGEMNIFHRRLNDDSKGPVIFSVANVLNPGIFDLNNMDEFRTFGVSLFLALPTAIKNLDAFEQMLIAAQQIRSALDGEIKDDQRNIMTAQTIEHYRQRVQDFELRRLKAVGGRA